MLHKLQFARSRHLTSGKSLARACCIASHSRRRRLPDSWTSAHHSDLAPLVCNRLTGQRVRDTDESHFHATFAGCFRNVCRLLVIRCECSFSVVRGLECICARLLSCVGCLCSQDWRALDHPERRSFHDLQHSTELTDVVLCLGIRTQTHDASMPLQSGTRHRIARQGRNNFCAYTTWRTQLGAHKSLRPSSGDHCAASSLSWVQAGCSFLSHCAEQWIQHPARTNALAAGQRGIRVVHECTHGSGPAVRSAHPDPLVSRTVAWGVVISIRHAVVPSSVPPKAVRRCWPTMWQNLCSPTWLQPTC